MRVGESVVVVCEVVVGCLFAACAGVAVALPTSSIVPVATIRTVLKRNR